MPSSLATLPIWPPDSSTRRTASALNSAVNRRRGRRSLDPDTDTPNGAHAHKVGVRQTGATSDLQWADRAAVLLLLCLTGPTSRARVVGTYRAPGATPGSHLGDLMA